MIENIQFGNTFPKFWNKSNDSAPCTSLFLFVSW